MYNGDMSTYYAEKFYTMGKRIEARLVALDMNQTDLHDELRRLGVHVSRSFISQLIGDKKSISAENLPYLARALETTTDHLLLLRDDPEPYTEKEATYYTIEAEKIADIVDQLEAPSRAMLLGIMQMVLEHEREMAKREWTSLLNLVERSVGRNTRAQIEAALAEENARNASGEPVNLR